MVVVVPTFLGWSPATYYLPHPSHRLDHLRDPVPNEKAVTPVQNLLRTARRGHQSIKPFRAWGPE